MNNKEYSNVMLRGKYMKNLKVVVAEDEILILMGLKSNLESLGCIVIGEATNGKELIDIVLEKKTRFNYCRHQFTDLRRT